MPITCGDHPAGAHGETSHAATVPALRPDCQKLIRTRIRRVRRLAALAGLATALLALVAAAPTIPRRPQPPHPPPGWYKYRPLPAHTQTVTAGGMPGAGRKP